MTDPVVVIVPVMLVVLTTPRVPPAATVTLPSMVPVTVVMSVWIVVAPTPVSVPEIVPPSSVLSPEAETVPARSPSVWP